MSRFLTATFTVLSAIALCACTATQPGSSASQPVRSAPPPGSTNSESRTTAPTSDGPSVTSSPPALVPSSNRWRPGRFQKGVQVYWHSPDTPDSARAAGSILDYIVSLGGNSVGITFPVYTDGYRPTKTYRGEETPSPRQVGSLTRLAKERGLRVMIRPIIDEANIMVVSGEWRGTLKPRDIHSWFASYLSLLAPYLEVAGVEGADEFVVGTELFSLQSQAREWDDVVKQARSRFNGTISYGANWDAAPPSATTFSSLGLDLYPAVNLGDDATVDQLSAALASFIGRFKQGAHRELTVQEVGIPAVSGMYPHPWLWDAPGGTTNYEVQSHWFAAACQAAKSTGVQGLYYWMLDSNVDPATVDPAGLPSASFIGRPAETAIKACYKG